MPAGRPGRLFGWLGWLLVVAATARVAVLTLVPLGDPGGSLGERMQDFRDAAYYPACELFRSGGMPYDPEAMLRHWPVVQEFDLYLPAHLLLVAPLAALDFRPAAAIMLLLDAGLLVLLARWTIQWWRPALLSGPAWPLLAAGLLVSQLGKAQLYLGQVNPLVAVGAAGSLGWRDRPRLAAACLALAWIKPQFGLPLSLLLLARGRRRTAITGTALAALASLPVVTVLVARAGGLAGFAEVIRGNVAYAASTGYGAVDSATGQRIDLVAVLARLFTRTPPAVLQLLASVAVLGAGALLVRRITAEDGVPRAVADLGCLLTMLVAVVHQPGDLLAALPAAVSIGAVAGTANLYRPPYLAALGALTIPFLHLDFVVRAVVAVGGRRLDGLIDGCAVIAAWLIVCGLLVRLRERGFQQRTPDDEPVPA